MKVLLIKDVYKLGRAGDVKRVADGYGRNFLIPQGLAVLATPLALKKAETIRTQASVEREVVNKEMSGLAALLENQVIAFPAKAGETGKLYGSITPQMISEAVKSKTGIELNRRQLDAEPIRTLGSHKVHIRLTVDLVPVITVIVHREGEAPTIETPELEAETEDSPTAPEVVEIVEAEEASAD